MAQNQLGQCYSSGKDLPKDDALAAFWFRKAAEQGDDRAQYNLGISYYNGEGVAKDMVEAYAYLNLASASDEFAKEGLALLEKKLSMKEIEAGQKRARDLQRAVEARKDAAEKKNRKRGGE